MAGVVHKSLLHGLVVFSYDLVFLAVFGLRLLAVCCHVLVFLFSDVPVDGSCSLLAVGGRLSSDDC